MATYLFTLYKNGKVSLIDEYEIRDMTQVRKTCAELARNRGGRVTAYETKEVGTCIPDGRTTLWRARDWYLYPLNADGTLGKRRQ